MSEALGRPRLALGVSSSSAGLFLLALTLCTFSINFFSQEPYIHQINHKEVIQVTAEKLTYPDTCSPTSFINLYFFTTNLATFVHNSFFWIRIMAKHVIC